MTLVAAPGVDPARLLRSSRPSAGEARKLMVAAALTCASPALLLDEPTHHLELPSVSHLEQALAAYAGALVVVTHDDAFARAAALEERWTVRRADGGRSVEVTSTTWAPSRA